MSKSLGTGIDPMQLIEGGPRPPVFTEGGDFPAYGADAVRWGLLAISSSQDVRFNEERVAQGRQLANKLYNASRLVLLRVPEGTALPGRRAGARDRRGRLDPLAPAGRRRRDVARGDRRLRLPRRRAAGLRLRLRRAVRLVPRAGQAAPVRGGQRRGRRVRAARAGRDAGARAPADPVRDRGDLGHVPGARRPADGAPLPGGRRGADATRTPRRSSRARSRRCRSCAPGATASAPQPGRPIPARLDGDGLRGDRRATWRGSRGWSGPPTAASRWRRSAVPGAHGGGLRLRRRRPRGRGSAARRRAARELEAEIARAEGKLANERLRGQGAGGGRAGRARQARAPAGGARGAVTWCRGARRGAPALARAVRHALRAGAHAAAADRARQPAGALRARSTSSAPTARARRCA